MNYKLILSVKDAEDHSRWLETRNMGIGGSDAAVIMGMNKYKSPYQLWLEKTGQVEPEDLSDNQYIYWGQKNEANIADWFSETTGKKSKRMGTVQSNEHPFMVANVDRMIVGENAGLEIKTAGVSQYRYWKGDNIPDAYYCQCLHYMAVTGADKWYIAVLLGGNEAIWKEIPRNEDDIQTLIEAEENFWDMVMTKTPPPVDGSSSCSQALASKYLGGGDENILDDFEPHLLKIRELTELQDSLKSQIEEEKNIIKEAMGDSEKALIGNTGVVTWKATKPRETLSLSKLKKADDAMYQDLLAKKYITLSKPSRTFTVKFD